MSTAQKTPGMNDNFFYLFRSSIFKSNRSNHFVVVDIVDGSEVDVDLDDRG